jgi:hypothetical protein
MTPKKLHLYQDLDSAKRHGFVYTTLPAMEPVEPVPTKKMSFLYLMTAFVKACFSF